VDHVTKTIKDAADAVAERPSGKTDCRRAFLWHRRQSRWGTDTRA